eukprot:gene14010-18790_t
MNRLSIIVLFFTHGVLAFQGFSHNKFAQHKFSLKDSSSPETDVNPIDIPSQDELQSPEIAKLKNRITELTSTIVEVRANKVNEEKEIKKLDEEFGGEIIRIKKEFARMKERAFEESTEISNKAKIDALKEVLPITDNYYRAKKLFDPPQTGSEQKLLSVYDDIFASFSKVIEGFGVTRVESLGKPFDFNFMEAIMTAPSYDYAADLVCTEYQVGYKMGDKCIRPSMVVVSLGPGP